METKAVGIRIKQARENANITQSELAAAVDGHDMYSKGYARFFYRGENAYHGQSWPSLF